MKRILTFVLALSMAPVSYTHLDVYKRQELTIRAAKAMEPRDCYHPANRR